MLCDLETFSQAKHWEKIKSCGIIRGFSSLLLCLVTFTSEVVVLCALAISPHCMLGILFCFRPLPIFPTELCNAIDACTDAMN
jgi:hypothetical protein